MMGDTFHVRGRAPAILSFGHVIRILSAGSHHPLLCELADGNGDTGLWVVKPQCVVSKSVGRQELIVLAELAGAEVCTWAGVHVPATGLLRFPESERSEIMNLFDGADDEMREVRELFGVNRGRLASCSRFLEGAVDVLPRILQRRCRRPETARAAIGLMLADVFMCHDDRDAENSNALFLGDDLVAIDHGLAFVGLDRPQESGGALAGRKVFFAKRHVARRAVRKLSGSALWDDVARALETVNDAEITALLQTFPLELENDLVHGVTGLRKRMLSFLLARRGHVQDLKTAIVSSLGGVL
jgi:hypothetical protein